MKYFEEDVVISKMGDVGDILEACMLFDQKLQDTDDTEKRHNVIREHINLVENKLKVKCPQFKTGKIIFQCFKGNVLFFSLLYAFIICFKKKTGHKMINMRLIKRIQLFISFVYLVYV